MAQIQTQYDCVVIGGGPAGSTSATLVAKAGHAVLLVDRDQMPRPHVGESLMPESYWVFERLGLLEALARTNFPRKIGVQFVSDAGRESQPFFFRSHDPHPSSETWHVDRPEFDQLLFQNAEQHGADCHQGIRVTDVILEDGQATGVALTDQSGKEYCIKTRVVVDATGQQALLANKLGLRRLNPDLKKAAIWRHYRGGERDETGGGVKTIILHTAGKQSWFWYIPQSNDLVSVGCVGDNDYLLKDRTSPEQTFAEELAKCEAMQSRLAGAEAQDDLRVDKEFSYSTDQISGNGWVLVGDAWGFIDPVYSSGVYFALKSAELAADCIVEGLAQGDTSAAQLGQWGPGFKEATNSVRQLVHAFYSGDFRVGRFVADHPEHQGNLTDLLIGRIFHESAGEIFKDMDPWLEKLRQDA
jgi:flavin-dependent dehydrogenase